MRLDLYLNLTLKLDKKTIQTILKNGEIKINDDIVKSNKHRFNLGVDKVYYQNSLLTSMPFTYIMLNKPKGYLSANNDLNNTTVMDLIDEKYRHLSIVGRLDKDTTGLMILTDDKIALKHLTHPNFNHEKEYIVNLKNNLTDLDVEKFKKGIIIDKHILLQPAILQIIQPKVAKVIIKEGKYHQIKKMFLSLGNEVVELKRIRINKLILDQNLKEGEYKKLTEKEINKLLDQIDFGSER